MGIVTLTPLQRSNIKVNSRFQEFFRQAVYAESLYKRELPGTGIATAVDAEKWAKSRFVAFGIIQHPTSFDFSSWLEQAYIKLAGMNVYDDSTTYSEETVITYMSDNSKFTELAGLVFDIKIAKIEF